MPPPCLVFDRLQAIDSTLCLLLFFPSMLFFWRGIWDLYGVYIFPGDSPRFEWATAAMGACSIVGYFACPLLSRCLETVQLHGKVLRFVFVRLYMYAFGILAMANWRGVWGVADYYLMEFGWKANLIVFLSCYSFLLSVRCSRTLVFPPFVVYLDTRDDLLVPSTCFQSQVNWREPVSVLRYSLDCLFTQYFVMTATVMTWRSSVTTLDAYFMPSDELTSNLVSSGVGLVGCAVLFALETPLCHLGVHLQRNHRYAVRLLYEDLVYLVVFAVENFLWRGVWNLNAKYLFEDQTVGGWFNHSLGLLLLLSLQLLSYVSCCGCAFDGQDEDPRDAIFPTKYLRTYSPYLSEAIKRIGKNRLKAQNISPNSQTENGGAPQLDNEDQRL